MSGNDDVHSTGTDGDVEVEIEVSTTQAAVGADFVWPLVGGVAVHRVVVIPSGATTASLTVPLINDDDFEVRASVSRGFAASFILQHPQEVDEVISFRIASVSGGASITPSASEAEVTILDDGDVSPPGVPRKPVLVRATGGVLELSVATSDPLNTGGAAEVITARKLFRVIGDGTYTEVDLVVGGLAASSTYSFVLVVSNSLFDSPKSEPLVVTTLPATAASEPLDVQQSDVTGGIIVVRWAAPFDQGGAPVVGYTIDMFAVGSDGLVRVYH